MVFLGQLVLSSAFKFQQRYLSSESPSPTQDVYMCARVLKWNEMCDDPNIGIILKK